jgi:hypothetical protein
MVTILAAVFLVALAMGGLALGILLGREALKGSCGGIACRGACESCPGLGQRKS